MLEVEYIPLGEDASSYDGGVSTVVLRGTGTVVSADAEEMTAEIAMDEDSGILADREVVFDFSSHTEYLPVMLDAVQPGDRVEVTYFYAENSRGYLCGESIVPASGRP